MTAGSERHTVIYYGPPALGQLLGQHLEDEGCRVHVPPMQERRDLAGAAQDLVVEILAWGTISGIVAGIRKFKSRRPQAKIEIDDQDSKGYL